MTKLVGWMKGRKDRSSSFVFFLVLIFFFGFFSFFFLFVCLFCKIIHRSSTQLSGEGGGCRKMCFGGVVVWNDTEVSGGGSESVGHT